MNKVCLLSIITLMVTLLTMPAYADVKLAVVDMQVVLQKAPQIAKINEALTRQFKSRQDSIVKEQTRLQAEANQLQKNGAVMTPGKRNQLQENVMTDQNKIKTMVASFEKDLSKQQSESLHNFSLVLQNVVSKLAEQLNLDVVLQKGSTLFAKNNLDITNQVLEALKKA